MEKEIVNQLNYVVKHGTTLRSSREYIWKSLFERIVPKKFNIDRSVFIIDSYGNISKKVDLAIYDEQYTPYIFCYGTIKFIGYKLAFFCTKIYILQGGAGVFFGICVIDMFGLYYTVSHRYRFG